MNASTNVIGYMSRAPVLVSIKPSVFFWLLDKSGWTIPEIASKIEYDETEIQKWKKENETIKIPLSKVEIVSKTIKRPLSAFLMARPPPELRLPQDFRKLAETPQGEIPTYTKETLLAFRKATRLQEVANELLKNIGAPQRVELPNYTILDNFEEKAEIERLKSGISIEMQIKWSNPTNSYNVWREWLASQGIFVFQFDIPLEDARGFSLIESDPKIIVVSKNDAIRGRIFSLFHEYAHILLREFAICNMDSDTSTNSEVARIENWCNNFAGSFLLPKDEIVREFEVFSSGNNNFMKFLEDRSKRYKTSSESILVRLKFLNLIKYPFYLAIKENIRSAIREKKLKEKEEREARKAKGIETPFRQDPKNKTVWTDRGINFVSLVLENSNRGYITERDVMDILDLRIDHLVKLLQQ